MRFFIKQLWLTTIVPFRAFGGTCFGEMADSNSYRHSDDKLAELDNLHAAQEFISKEIELWIVNEDDDDGQNRTIYHFGDTCPLHLGEGVNVCKAFSDMLHKCKSCVSETCARNYLAQHAYSSTNHADTLDDSEASFEAANNAQIYYGEETVDERAHVRTVAAAMSKGEVKQEVKQEPMRPSQLAKPAPRRALRLRSTSAPVIGAGPRTKGRSRSRRRVSCHRGPSTRERSSPVRSQEVAPIGAATQEIAPIAMSATVKMAVGDLRSLSNYVSNMCNSQKRMYEHLKYITRQLEGERKVFHETQSVINSMVSAAELRCSRH